MGIVIIILCLFIIYKTITTFMATLADFQAQIASIDASLTAVAAEITDLQSQLSGTLSAADADAVLVALTDIATKLAAIAPKP